VSKYTLHLSFFCSLLLIIFFGILSENLIIAKLAGALSALMLDPLIIVSGLSIGIFVRDRTLIFASIATVAVIATYIVIILNESAFSFLLFSLRCLAVSAWFLIANALFLYKAK